MDEYISIGYLLNTAARLARQDLGNRMHALGLTFPQWTVLKDLACHQGCHCDELNMAAIARRLNTQRPNILGILHRLENLGLVQRTVNPDNRRAHIVSLTDRAKEAMAQLQELSRLTTAKALHGFTPQEEANLRNYLIRISNNLGESATDNCLKGCDSI